MSAYVTEYHWSAISWEGKEVSGTSKFTPAQGMIFPGLGMARKTALELLNRWNAVGQATRYKYRYWLS